MTKMITKTVNVTTVKYSLIKVVNGAPAFEEQPMAVFSGIYSEKRIKNAMRKLLGPDAQYIITESSAARKTLGMSFEDFVRQARELTAEEQATAEQEEETSEELGEEQPTDGEADE